MYVTSSVGRIDLEYHKILYTIFSSSDIAVLWHTIVGKLGNSKGANFFVTKEDHVIRRTIDSEITYK